VQIFFIEPSISFEVIDLRLFHSMQHDRLLSAAAESATTAIARRSVTGGRSTARRRPTGGSVTAGARAATAAAEDSRSQCERIVIGQFEVPGYSARLGYPCDGLAGDRSAFNVQYGRVPDFRDRSRHLSAGVGLEIHDDGLPAATTTAPSASSTGLRRRSVLLGLERGWHIVCLPLSRQACLRKDYSGHEDHGGEYQ
jgi:hypothetical protein